MSSHPLHKADNRTTMLTDDELAIQMHLETLKAKLFPKHPFCELSTHDAEPTTQPALVLCPSDFLTTFYALFPKHRPLSSTQPLQIPPSPRHTHKTSHDSAKSEVARSSSDYIRPILKRSGMVELHDGSTSSHSEVGPPTSELESPMI